MCNSHTFPNTRFTAGLGLGGSVNLFITTLDLANKQEMSLRPHPFHTIYTFWESEGNGGKPWMGVEEEITGTKSRRERPNFRVITIYPGQSSKH